MKHTVHNGLIRICIIFASGTQFKKKRQTSYFTKLQIPTSNGYALPYIQETYD